ncbi:hypothetical protein CON64_10080 [Bacillus pseudomycoides]|nr:hypothetical protein CON64_10080 [Bacillus pseudomycoides]
MQWYVNVLKNYAQFQGRARRKEYWTFTLINYIIFFAFGTLGKTVDVFNTLVGLSYYFSHTNCAQYSTCAI